MATRTDERIRAPVAGPRPPRRDDGPTELSWRDWPAVFKRAGKETLDDNVPMVASALAYSSFLAIPSVLLVAVGLFTALSGPGTITRLMNRFDSVMPQSATQLLGDSLQRLNGATGTTVVMTAVGFVLALWATTGAMTTFMTALNIAYDRKDSRSFVKKRLVALAMVGAIGFAFLAVAVLLIFGPQIERWIGNALGIQSFFGWIWWAAQWPILIVALLGAFGVLLRLGPDVDHLRWRLVTPGSAIAVLAWLAVSGLFAVYTANFGSYNKTWGSLSAVIVMLTWLWLSGIALLFGAEVNAELERSRRPHR